MRPASCCWAALACWWSRMRWCGCPRRSSPNCAKSCFRRSRESAVRQLALKVFRHLHGLSLRFHLDRQTGGMSRDIERGTRGITQLISYSLYSILPTLVEVGLVLGFFVVKYEAYYAIVTFVALAVYIIVHREDDRVAHAFPPHDERPRFARELACDRFAAQLRDRQIFRQRGVGSAALRRKSASATGQRRSSRRTRYRC